MEIITSSQLKNDLERSIHFQPLRFEKVMLKNGCDIGIGTIILPDDTIDKGVIIGAGSVVVGSIPEYYVAIGIPTRVIR